MVKYVQSRLDSDERGFTLIELLVVMIIISILMAVAIPVFLNQKQKALATNAKTNATHVANTIEGCSAGTTSGTLIEGTLNCTTPAQITVDEPSLGPLFTGTNCGGVVCVTMGATSPDSYVVNSRTNSTTAAGFATFSVNRTATGITHTCTASNAGTIARMCPTGKW